MIKKYSEKNLLDLFTAKKMLAVVMTVAFALILTVLLSVKYYLFQNIVDSDNASKKDVYAQKDITVTDFYKTDLQKKAAIQSINPILTLGESSYIKYDLQTLITKISEIRSHKYDKNTEMSKLMGLFTMVSQPKKEFVSFYLSSIDIKKMHAIMNPIPDDLNNILPEIKAQGDEVCSEDMVRKTISNYIRNKRKLSFDQTRVTSVILEQVINSNIVINEQATELAKKQAEEAVVPYTKTFKKGEKIIEKGQKINRFERSILKEAGYNVLDLNFQSFCGLFAIVVISIVAFLLYLYSFERQYFTINNIIVTALLTLFMVAIVAIRPDMFSIYIVPGELFTISIAVLTNSNIAFLATLILLSDIGIAYQIPVEAFIIFVFVSLFICITIAKIGHSKRVNLIQIGILSAIVISILISCCFIIARGISDPDTVQFIKDLLTAALVCIVSGVMALGMLPMFETVFKIITPFSLAELGDPNQPLLKKLQTDAPGTYAHSVAVANMAESAAEAINADPILTKVGGLYHDIGKLKRPLFFIENQPFFSIENPHNKINPKVSKMIVTAHTKDGVELAKDKGLPQVVQDMILQHHGQSLASYFYYEALKAEGEDKITKEQFRYNGQKPQTKEAAILMIADAVEAAARTLKDDYTQEELQGLISKIIKDKLNDGQLSESPLTLKDLKVIAQTFDRILRAAHHQRIKYHEDIMQELEYKHNDKS